MPISNRFVMVTLCPARVDEIIIEREFADVEES